MASDRTKGTSIPARKLSPKEIAEGCILALEDKPTRPKTRGDCKDGERPCPWCGCRYHLYLDIMTTTGSLKLNFGDVELDKLPDTCALDVADRGGGTLEVVGARLNVTRERIRQVEAKMLVRLFRKLKAAGIENAEGFFYTQHVLAQAQEDGDKATGATVVGRAAGELNKRYEAAAEARALELEQTRAQRVAELGPKVAPPKSTTTTTKRRAGQAEMLKEQKMRASKMDGIKGKGGKLVQNALIDRDIGAQALFTELDEMGVVEEYELTLSGIGYYLRTRRAAIDAGELEEPEVKEKAYATPAPEKLLEAPVAQPALVPMGGGAAPSQGYVVLTDGAIWTSSPDAALELQQRILEKKC